jgi:ligand-binding SRPBCC domain-containing protein
MDGNLGARQKFLDNGSQTFLADKIRYMLKAPRTAYRIYKREQVTDGESLGCFRQRKSELRKGDRITCST